jgi:hypothetical protein
MQDTKLYEIQRREQFTLPKALYPLLQIDNNIAIFIHFNTSSIKLKHYIRPHSVFDTSSDLISRMDQSSMLEDKDAANPWINVESAFLVG